MGVFFLFHFLYKGYFACKSMESGIKEGAITSILEHYKAHLTSSKKLPIYFFMKFAQFEE